MQKLIVAVSLLSLPFAGCSRSSTTAVTATHDYSVVQEGAAGGASSTVIGGPDGTTMTNTAVDTTTNISILQNGAPPAAPTGTGSIASSLPPPNIGYGTPAGVPPAPAATSAPRPHPAVTWSAPRPATSTHDATTSTSSADTHTSTASESTDSNESTDTAGDEETSTDTTSTSTQ